MDDLLDLSTMNYLVIFVDEVRRREMAEFIIEKHQLSPQIPDFMKKYEESYGSYLCLNVEDLPWEDVYIDIFKYDDYSESLEIVTTKLDVERKIYFVVIDSHNDD